MTAYHIIYTYPILKILRDVCVSAKYSVIVPAGEPKYIVSFSFTCFTKVHVRISLSGRLVLVNSIYWLIGLIEVLKVAIAYRPATEPLINMGTLIRYVPAAGNVNVPDVVLNADAKAVPPTVIELP
jgi:hypothetical protein